MSVGNQLNKFWSFLKADTWQSWIVSLVLLIIFIRLIFFPFLSFVTGTSLPLVIVESCSMYHGTNFDSWWDNQGAWYESHGISKDQFSNFPFKNGLNKGDILIVLGAKETNIGDVIIFNAGSKYPLIHRIVSNNTISTKGDHNYDQLKSSNNNLGIDETHINSNDIVGQARFKVIPLLGWIKLIWFEPFKSQSERGFC